MTDKKEQENDKQEKKENVNEEHEKDEQKVLEEQKGKRIIHLHCQTESNYN